MFDLAKLKLIDTKKEPIVIKEGVEYKYESERFHPKYYTNAQRFLQVFALLSGSTIQSFRYVLYITF